MIMPSDKDYKETKLIMQGKAAMKEEFVLLANWIDKEYNVKTINFYYDIMSNGNTPRLGVFFETAREARSFHRDGEFAGFDTRKQNAIAKKFREFIGDEKLLEKRSFFGLLRSKNKYRADGLFVYTSAFEPIAKIEANEKIPQTKIDQLKKQIDNIDIWEISRAFSGVTFLLFTDDQVKKYEDSEIKKSWADKYFDILKDYDEFKYFKKDFFNIYLDSKENFDNNYGSNWYYYYK